MDDLMWAKEATLTTDDVNKYESIMSVIGSFLYRNICAAHILRHVITDFTIICPLIFSSKSSF